MTANQPCALYLLLVLLFGSSNNNSSMQGNQSRVLISQRFSSRLFSRSVVLRLNFRQALVIVVLAFF